MAKHVLLIPGKSDPGYFSLLLNAFSNAYLSVKMPEPESTPAEVVRWVQANEPEAACCVVCEHAGSALAITVAMACGKIPTVVILLEEASISSTQSVLASTPALIAASRDPEQIADTVARLTVAVARLSLPGAPAPVTATPSAPAAQTKSSANKPATPTPALSAPEAVSDDDHAVLRDLERRMNQPVKTPQPKYEIPIQQQPLDFSIPLREALTSARSFALGEGTDVASINHLVAGIANLPDPVYGHAVRRAGFSVSASAPVDTSQMEPAELPPPSSEVFEAMKLAKVVARARGAQCLCIRDVFEAVLLTLNPDTDLPDEADGAIAALPTAEPWQESFFKPSSLDQAGFVEFHSQEFSDIQNRLAPMLDKVEKAKPAKKKSAGASASKPPRPLPPSAEPPEELQVEVAKPGFPDVDLVEAAADLLLEGQVIALPTDAGYVALADLTNLGAVERLRQLGDGQALQVLIHSTTQLRLLVGDSIDTHERFFDDIWPGQVGVTFPKPSPIIRQLNGTEDVALRVPADDLTLAVLSMLSRPTAAINLVGIDGLEEQLTGLAAMLIRGETTRTARPTLIRIEGNKRSLIQEGAISRASLDRWLTQ